MNIMLDLETMDVGPNAAIISIGAVMFSIDQGVYNEFICNVDLESSIATGGTVNPQTVKWWLTQPFATRERVLKDAKTLEQVLIAFSDWVSSDFGIITRFKTPAVWGNGSDFDCVILSTSFQRLGITRPWNYVGTRCYRTLKNIYPQTPFKREGISHDALCDARNQASYLILLAKTYNLELK